MSTTGMVDKTGDSSQVVEPVASTELRRAFNLPEPYRRCAILVALLRDHSRATNLLRLNTPIDNELGRSPTNFLGLLEHVSSCLVQLARRSQHHEQRHLSNRLCRRRACGPFFPRTALGAKTCKTTLAKQGRTSSPPNPKFQTRSRRRSRAPLERFTTHKMLWQRKASEYASEAKEALFEHAEGTQQNLSANMAAFGGALRAASEHLANSDQRAASKFVLDAAGGLERLSSSLKNKPFEEVLGEIRSFGRQNSGALIAGSVLAGLALGRFIKSSDIPTARTDAAAGERDREFAMPRHRVVPTHPQWAWRQRHERGTGRTQPCDARK